MRRSIKWIVLAVCLGTILHADYYLGSIFKENPSVLNTLSNSEFTALKMKVTQELNNSWCSAEKVQLLMDLVLLIRPQVCVEVGAFTGSSVLPVAAALKYLKRGKIFAIDAWSNAEAIKHLTKDDPNMTWWSQVDMNAVHSRFKQLVAKWSLKSFCTEIHEPSEKAIDKIPESIDFLHLDGDYSKIGALRDVELYLPKVRSGGYILLSNLFMMINREQPKVDSFCVLFDKCELMGSIEQDNVVLFRKL